MLTKFIICFIAGIGAGLGIKFIVKPVMTTKEAMASVDSRKRFVQSVACERVYHGIYRIHRSGKPFRHRRYAGSVVPDLLRIVYASVGTARRPLCQQGKRNYPEPCHWYCTCSAWGRNHDGRIR